MTPAPLSTEDFVAAVLRGEVRPAGRLMSLIEAGKPAATPVVQALHRHGGKARIVGVTGAPGAGKSTLVDQLLAHCRRRGERVAVLAIDPSSPFSGGAILGDRVRMARHNIDRDVFIRSMAARGRLGGLSAATADALTVLDAMGFDHILIETVGVGQSELDIIRLAQTVVIVQTPASGDVIQAEKAGLLEVGDVLVVNKADGAGADRMVSALREAVELGADHANPAQWLPPVLKSQASADVGVAEILAAIEAHAEHLDRHPDQRLALLKSQAQARVLDLMEEQLRSRYRAQGERGAIWQAAIAEVVDRRSDPHAAAARLLRA